MLSLPYSRRGALALTAALTAGCATAQTVTRSPPGLFRHGVASGDPRLERVIIWTRVTCGSGAEATLWEVARDEGFSNVVARGASLAGPDADFTIKIDVEGLEPGQRYWYRFKHGDEFSPVGRTGTLPIGSVQHVRFAVASCAHHAAGYFNAYRAIADTADIDCVVHLGDYLYEHGRGGPWTHLGRRLGRTPDPPHELVTLSDYRQRYAQYRLDADLSAAHQAAPWIVIWDDHESADNSWPGGARRHDDNMHGAWVDRREASLQAYYEWMPIREPARGRTRAQAWRAYEWGSLATLIVLETRLAARSAPLEFADALAAVDASENPQDRNAAMQRFLDERVGDPHRELLGAEQLNWVGEELSRSAAASKPWQVLANQTAMASMTLPNLAEAAPAPLRWLAYLRGGQVWDYLRASEFGAPASLDAWDGFPAERERLYAAAREAGANLITLTGDTHAFFAATLNDREGHRIGVELGATSVSSPSDLERAPSGVDVGALAREANPEALAYFNEQKRGFLLLDLTPEAAEATMIAVTTALSQVYESYPLARFTVQPVDGGGTSGLAQVAI
jgi:phosphodiesterase/alkaline phosphatase D-like protein